MNPIGFGGAETSARDGNLILQFKRDFNCENSHLKGAFLKVCSDFRYAAYINGEFVTNAQFSDGDEIKTYDEIEVSRFLKLGENQILIVIFHYEGDHQVVRATKKAFCAFEIVSEKSENDKIIVCSDENTLVRKAKGYSVGDLITSQLGYCFNYDFTDEGEAWQHATLISADFTLQKRPVKRCDIFAPQKSEILAQGTFKYDGGQTSGEKMQRAYMRSVSFGELTAGEKRVERALLSCENALGLGENALKNSCAGVRFALENIANAGEIKPDGVFVVADLGCETCGYLSISLTAEEDCDAIIGWGEHLADLRPRTSVGGRNFALSLRLKKGENVLDDRLLRFGLRYLCLFVESKSIIVKRLTVCPTQYPFNFIKKDFGDGLLNKIYETGRRTLALCAHEHYEDCPWREQALYGMDSRNQMLFGYGAFGEYEFARASLKLFAQTMRSDGLVELCPPSRVSFTIPSFTLYWIIGVCENAVADYNKEFLDEILPTVKSAADNFATRAGDNGIKVLDGEANWNFHEWSDGLDGFGKDVAGSCDGILTGLAVIALSRLSALLTRYGDTSAANRYEKVADRLKTALNAFYNPQKGFYCSYLKEDGSKFGYHEYTQAVILAAGACDKKTSENLVYALKNGNDVLVKMTYSAMLIKYEAIIAADKNADWCVENIVQTFAPALLGGATSFYETALGEADFDDAGSLCHGWSAVACYVLDEYAKLKN